MDMPKCASDENCSFENWCPLGMHRSDYMVCTAIWLRCALNWILAPNLLLLLSHANLVFLLFHPRWPFPKQPLASNNFDGSEYFSFGAAERAVPVWRWNNPWKPIQWFCWRRELALTMEPTTLHIIAELYYLLSLLLQHTHSHLGQQYLCQIS